MGRRPLKGSTAMPVSGVMLCRAAGPGQSPPAGGRTLVEGLPSQRSSQTVGNQPETGSQALVHLLNRWLPRHCRRSASPG